MSRILTATPALLVLACGWFWQAPSALAERKRFDGHQVVKVTITDEADLQAVYKLEAASTDFDVWSDRIGIGVVDVRVSPEQKRLLDANGLAYVVVVDDVQALFHYERSGGAGFFDDFRTFEEYLAFMSNLASTYPDLAEVISLGTSLEGRDMWALRITGPGENKPGVLYNGCIHAGEWFTSPIVAYTAEFLLTNYDTDPTIRTLVDNVEWIMMPILNVDGYVYTWTTDRSWRKNRRDNGDGTFGVDLNRNWGRGWGGVNTDGNPGSSFYRGPSAFSEPETRVVRDFLLANPNIRSYVDVHIFGGFLGWPWGYVDHDTPDEPTFSIVGQAMARQIRAVIGTEYRLGPLYTVGGRIGGTTVDWIYGDAGLWSYVLEMYAWSYDFAPEEILPACEEHFSAMLLLGAWTGACDPYGSRAGLAMAPDEFPDCNNNGRPDLCELIENSAADCNGNWIPDACDLADGTSVDCDGNGIPNECEADCNGNAMADPCDILDGISQDCNGNGIPDECDFVNARCGPPIGSCPGEGDCLNLEGNGTPGCDCAACCYAVCNFDSFCCDYSWDEICASLAAVLPDCQTAGPGGVIEDCNSNGVLDECDIADGTSGDCNANEMPDECDPDLDCNNNGVQDVCDVAAGSSDDCDANEIPDECDEDCNTNGVPDACDLGDGTSEDCNGNGVPDECDPNEDCNSNGVQDICDIATGSSGDCGTNEIPDECEPDCNANGAPDDCDLIVPPDLPTDDCMDANSVCTGNTYTGTTVGSTNDGSTPCAPTMYGPDVWYRYAPIQNGTLTVSLCGSLYDTVVSIYTGCPAASGYDIDCNDDYCGLQSRVSTTVTAGAEYRIRIAGRARSIGSFTMTLTGPDSASPCEAASADCNNNDIPDECELASGTSSDCNANEILDQCDILTHSSEDCNTNGVPDECEPDCNANSVPDDCDLASGEADDCNNNDIVDDCEVDCNENGTPDDCDLAGGTSGDCNTNGIPDECDPDADGDGVTDECDPCPLDNPDDFDDDGACNSDDECPRDPDKIVAGECGCGEPEDDADGDGVPDCIDQCPGVDDALFGPECGGAIPTASAWGLLVLTLLLLAVGKVYFAATDPEANADGG